jgi:hypothetical protein
MAEPDSVEVLVKLQYWEIYRSSVFLTTRLFRKVLYVWGTIIVAGAVVFLFAGTHATSNAELANLQSNFKPLYWVLLLPVIIVFVLPLLSARKIASDQRFQQGFRYLFTHDGLCIQSTVSRSEIKWKAITSAVETRDTLYVFSSKNVAHALPKRCFENTNDLDILRELLTTNVDDTKLAKS